MLEYINLYGMGAAGTLASLIYLFYSIREKVWLWPWGIVASLLSIAVFYNSRLYADMSLQLYYLVVSIYGWWYWTSSLQKKQKVDVPIVNITSRQIRNLTLIGSGTYLLILVALLKVPPFFDIPGSEMPYLDAATTAASFMATWMLARKIIEHWLIWIIVDFVSMVMYFYKAQVFGNSADLYFYSFLFLIYTAGAWWGFKQWQKLMSSESEI
nr:nicotinamide riboside transporter PnuC [uncultured Carboxylicivirga sp.]